MPFGKTIKIHSKKHTVRKYILKIHSKKRPFENSSFKKKSVRGDCIRKKSRFAKFFTTVAETTAAPLNQCFLGLLVGLDLNEQWF